MRVVPVALTDLRVEPLLAGLADEYERRYGPNDELATTSPEDFEPPAGRFLVVLDGAGRTVAGGGIRRIDDRVCEVKRMWTSPAHRRSGLARRVLAALEAEAAALGYAIVRLETGPLQPEAAALYHATGYRRIDRYGPYESALAFEKALGARDGDGRGPGPGRATGPLA